MDAQATVERAAQLIFSFLAPKSLAGERSRRTRAHASVIVEE
jgi:hypothetical protein